MEMSSSTSVSDAPGEMKTPPQGRSRPFLELLASMRFAIALLTVICMASVIGTVLRQNEPFNNYINQFGPFWAQVFGALNLYSVYSAPWFLLILAFLVVSTTLCLMRNTPKFLRDVRQFKEDLRVASLRAFHHRGQGMSTAPKEQTAEQVQRLLSAQGWRVKLQTRDTGLMLAAKRGQANKVGYIAAHSAIVLICLGGLLDGDLMVRAVMAIQGKTAFSGAPSMDQVESKHRLDTRTPTFRGNLLVPEGMRSGTAVLNLPKGVVLQDLPFDVELKRFIVEYYETGMPKLFASDIVIHDRDTGRRHTATVKVNEPVVHRGHTLYQSSFEDGGSKVRLRAHPMGPFREGFELAGLVGEALTLPPAYTRTGAQQLEIAELRVINVENMGPGDGKERAQSDGFGQLLQQHLGSGAKGPRDQFLRNIGPSIRYKLRDAAGQAREFHSYMVPVLLDGQRVFLTGVRDSTQESFRYIRMPADEQGSLNRYQGLRRALLDPAMREKAVQGYVRLATPPNMPEMAEQLLASATRALELFAGAQGLEAGPSGPGGFKAVSQFIEQQVPEGERQRISEVLLRILNGCVQQLDALARGGSLAQAETDAAFLAQAMMALSDNFAYPAPVWIQLDQFEQVQASVFQVAKAPGKTAVYLGAILLIVGVFAMLYVDERRLWVWISPADQGSALWWALSSPRKGWATDQSFARLNQDLAAVCTPAAPHAQPVSMESPP
jgi:cytochrome c biogenesis protein